MAILSVMPGFDPGMTVEWTFLPESRTGTASLTTIETLIFKKCWHIILSIRALRQARDGNDAGAGSHPHRYDPICAVNRVWSCRVEPVGRYRPDRECVFQIC